MTPKPKGKERTKDSLVAGLIVLLTTLLFILDLHLPLGVAGGVPYVLVVLVCLWSPRRWLPLQAAALCTALTIAGFYWSPEGGELWKVFTNRFLAIFAIWATGLLSLIRKQAEEGLKKANRELDAFVYTVSHDLRTPLTLIIGYADFLRESCRDRLDEQALDCLAEISASGEKMTALVENLLALAQVGRVERPAEPLDAGEVVNEVVCGLAGQITQAGVSVDVGALPALRVPRTMLVQVFDNLIGNAMRYGCKPGDVIEVGGERKGEKVCLYVRDYGPGVPGEERVRIFEVFYQGSTGKEKIGTGIGLATVQKIARLFDGRAWVEETPGGGSTFWVEIVDVPVSVPFK